MKGENEDSVLHTCVYSVFRERSIKMRKKASYSAVFKLQTLHYTKTDGNTTFSTPVGEFFYSKYNTFPE